MTDWLLMLILLSVAAVLSCFRFVGCALNTEGTQVGKQPPTPKPSYGDTIKAQAIAYWRLGEKAGTAQAKDEKDNNHGTYKITDVVATPDDSPATGTQTVLKLEQTGLLTGAPSQTSVRVDGGYVRVKYSLMLNPPANKPFSVEAWVHPEWTAGEHNVFRCVVASREDTGADKHGYILYAGPILDPDTFAIVDPMDPKMYWQAWVGNGGGVDGNKWLMLVGPTVELEETTYLLLTYDGAQKLTLDAITGNTMETHERKDRSMTAYSPNPAPAARPLFIGMGATEQDPEQDPLPDPPPAPRYPFLGRLQEVAFYDTALTIEEVAAHVEASGEFQ